MRGDPQLHDHLVVWNRAKSKSDGQWRTLDSRGLYKSVVTLGVMHEGVLSDLLTEALGVGWDQQSTRGGMVKTELAGVPDALMREFSQRREMIEKWRDGLVARFVTEHGREPSPVELMRLNQEANLATRKDKQHRSLAEMTDDWRARAVEYVGDDITARGSPPSGTGTTCQLLHADDLADDILADAASVACQKVAERHSTFSRANVLAEVHRQLQGVRFASPHDRVAVVERTADIALGAAIQVTAPELHHVPERYKRADGISRLRPADHRLYTTAALMDAESRLFAAGRRAGGAGCRDRHRGRRGGPELARTGLRDVHRPGSRRPEGRHQRATFGPARRPGRDREVDHDGWSQGGLGSRARSGLGDRSGAVRRRGRSAGRRVGDRYGEHGEVAA